MVYVMATIILAILAGPYVLVIFRDDHHSQAYGKTPSSGDSERGAGHGEAVATGAAASSAVTDDEVAAEAPQPAAAEPTAQPGPEAESIPEPEPVSPADEGVAQSAAPVPQPAAAAAVAVAGAAVAAAQPKDAPEPKPEPESAPAATPEKAQAAVGTDKPEKAPPDKPAVAARDLPSQQDVADWIGGKDVTTIGTLFEGLPLKRFDAFNTKIRAQEILPQHWQVISDSEVPDDSVFDGLPEVGRLRKRYKDQVLARQRLDAMQIAWRELRGKRPGLWQVPDLMAALRRIIQKDIDVDFHQLLHSSRDLWGSMTLPAGREQLDILWAVIDVVRAGVKK